MIDEQVKLCNHKSRKSNNYCQTCYQKERYRNDKDYREKQKAVALAWYNKMMKKDPEFNAKKQRAYRKNNPATFHLTMAKYYYKRLSLEQKKELLMANGLNVELKVKHKINCEKCNNAINITNYVNAAKLEERQNLINIVQEVKRSKSPYYKYLKKIGMKSSQYQLKLFKKRGYKTHYAYQNEWAKKHGYKSRWEYSFEKSAKKHGYERPIDMLRDRAIRRGFNDYKSYEEYLAMKKGYADRADYRRTMATKKKEKNET